MIQLTQVLLILACLEIHTDEAPTSKLARDAQAKYETATAVVEEMAVTKISELRKAYITDLTAARKKALSANDLDETQRIVSLIKALEGEKEAIMTLEPTEPFRSKAAKQAQDKSQKAKGAADLERATSLSKLREVYVKELTTARKRALAVNDLDEAQRIVAMINRIKAEDDTSGMINPKGWIVQCFPGVWTDYPLDKMRHTIKAGMLEFANNTGISDWAGIATRRSFVGNYTITVEVRNVTRAVSLRSAVGDSAWASTSPLGGNTWRKVVISRKNGQVTASVDGKPQQMILINPNGLDRAIFTVHINAGDTAAIRRFVVSEEKPKE